MMEKKFEDLTGKVCAEGAESGGISSLTPHRREGA
jgi:hypothetical protein